MKKINTKKETLPMKEENKIVFEQHLKEEVDKLAPQETNWYGILTNVSFVWRLVVVLAIMIICGLVILNVGLDSNSKSWYNQLHKADWMPDPITATLIFLFLSILLAWVWFRLNNIVTGIASVYVNLLFPVILIVQLLYTLFLYKYRNLEAARYLSGFYLGFMGLLFLTCFYYARFSDVALFTFMYTGWLVIVLCYTFQFHNLDKEYKLLGLAKSGTSLYKKKIKNEVMFGVQYDDKTGEKTEFDAEEQE
jgi:tryptophan-rich sensory protein